MWIGYVVNLKLIKKISNFLVEMEMCLKYREIISMNYTLDYRILLD